MREEPDRYRLVLLAGAFEGGLAVLAWGLGLLLRHPVGREIRWDARDGALGAAACLPLLLLFMVCVRWPVGPLARIRRFSEEVIRPLFAPCAVMDLAAISLLAGVGEETLFRGVIQGALGRWLGPWTGLAMASVLFGLLHSITLTYAVLATLMGAFLGWLYVVNGNLLLVIVTHGLYDFVALLVLVKGPRRPWGRATAPGQPPTEKQSEERPAEEAAE